MSAGAYGFLWHQIIIGPRPTEIMVEGDTWEIIRRETYTDLIKMRYKR